MGMPCPYTTGWPNRKDNATPQHPQAHGRRSMRLHGYDCSQPGAYFVTLCTHDRACLFDHPVLRAVIETCWRAIPRHFPQVTLDAFVVMPNHLHGILIITCALSDGDAFVDGRGKAFAQQPLSSNVHALAVSDARTASPHANALPLHGLTTPPAEPMAPPQGVRHGAAPGSLGAIVGSFKTVTSRRINGIRKSPGLTIWQRNYYEHIIRNERALAAIRAYIIDNPAHWAEDLENPAHGLADSDAHYASIGKW